MVDLARLPSGFAGLALLPQGVVAGLGTALGQRLATRISVRALVTAGFVLLAVTSAGFLMLDADTPLWATASLHEVGLILTALAAAAAVLSLRLAPVRQSAGPLDHAPPCPLWTLDVMSCSSICNLFY